MPLLILSPVEKSLHLSKISWKILLSQRNQHVGHYRASNLITYECVSHIYDSTCPPLWNEQLQASLHLAILEIVGRGRGTPTSCIKWCHDLIEARTSLGCLACFNMLQHASTCFNMLQPPSLYAVVHICIYMLQHGHILQHTSTYFFHSYLNSYIMDMLQLALLCAVYHITNVCTRAIII